MLILGMQVHIVSLGEDSIRILTIILCLKGEGRSRNGVFFKSPIKDNTKLSY